MSGLDWEDAMPQKFLHFGIGAVLLGSCQVRLSQANNVQAQDLGVAEPGGNRSSQIRPQTEKSGIFQESEQRDKVCLQDL